jgi:hypothetical protein
MEAPDHFWRREKPPIDFTEINQWISNAGSGLQGGGQPVDSDDSGNTAPQTLLYPI